jgi:thiamine biosynthesis lipoprotein
MSGSDDDAAAVFAELDRVLTAFGPKNATTTSLSTGSGGAPQSVDPEFFAVLVEVQRLSKLSRGAYDPTAVAFADLYAVGADGAVPPLPAAAVLKARKALVGTAQLNLDVPARTAQLKTAGAALDVSDVAWGYALDRARALLAERGVGSYVLSAGGDVVTHGRKADGSPWVVGVADPRGAGPFMTVSADESLGGAVMTSIDSEGLVVDADGARRHKLIDPRSGKLASQVRSVAVFADDALTGKCLSRAIFVLGVRDGLALAARLKGVEVVVVDAKNKVWTSAGLKALAKKGRLHQRPPTDGA